jgi:hypothetical protein
MVSTVLPSWEGGELLFPCVWLCAWPVIVRILSKTVYDLLIILGLEAHG